MTITKEKLKSIKVGDTFSMLVEGQFSDYDFNNLELKKIGTKYLYFEYMSDDDWMFEKGCKIKYEIKSSCAWVEDCDYKEECYVKDEHGNDKSGYKTNQKMKGKCYMSSVLIHNRKVIAGDKSIFGR